MLQHRAHARSLELSSDFLGSMVTTISIKKGCCKSNYLVLHRPNKHTVVNCVAFKNICIHSFLFRSLYFVWVNDKEEIPFLKPPDMSMVQLGPETGYATQEGMNGGRKQKEREDQTQTRIFVHSLHQVVLLQTDKKRRTLKMIWRCFICYVFVALTLKKLLSHVNNVHSRSPDFRVVCGIDGCSSEYRVYNSYYYHIKRTHAHYLQLGPATAEENVPTLPGTNETSNTEVPTARSSDLEETFNATRAVGIFLPPPTPQVRILLVAVQMRFAG